MKYLIASDIHGSSYYCEKLIERFNDEKADKLILLGDVLYHGPRNDLPRGYAPKKVIEMLNCLSDKIICVRGNCDAEVDQMVLNFSVMSESSALVDGEYTYNFTHGHHLDEFLKNTKGQTSTVFFGHTHIPECTDRNGILTVNPGSVSIPKDNSVNSYIILSGRNIEWKNIENGETYKKLAL